MSTDERMRVAEELATVQQVRFLICYRSKRMPADFQIDYYIRVFRIF